MAHDFDPISRYRSDLSIRSLDLNLVFRSRSGLSISIRSLDLNRDHKHGVSYIQGGCGSRQVARESAIDVVYTGTKMQSSVEEDALLLIFF